MIYSIPVKYSNSVLPNYIVVSVTVTLPFKFPFTSAALIRIKLIKGINECVNFCWMFCALNKILIILSASYRKWWLDGEISHFSRLLFAHKNIEKDEKDDSKSSKCFFHSLPRMGSYISKAMESPSTNSLPSVWNIGNRIYRLLSWDCKQSW